MTITTKEYRRHKRQGRHDIAETVAFVAPVAVQPSFCHTGLRRDDERIKG